jgi:hypothetical protein
MDGDIMEWLNALHFDLLSIVHGVVAGVVFAAVSTLLDR